MRSFLIYLFWPNPGNASYTSPKALTLLIACGCLIFLSLGIRIWRRHIQSGLLRKLSRSWATASFWFGITGLIMIVSRAEEIQYLSMRFLWVLWIAIALLYLFIQVRVWRARYYEVVPQATIHDPRDPYLPRKRRQK